MLPPGCSLPMLLLLATFSAIHFRETPFCNADKKPHPTTGPRLVDACESPLPLAASQVCNRLPSPPDSPWRPSQFGLPHVKSGSKPVLESLLRNMGGTPGCVNSPVLFTLIVCHAECISCNWLMIRPCRWLSCAVRKLSQLDHGGRVDV